MPTTTRCCRWQDPRPLPGKSLMRVPIWPGGNWKFMACSCVLPPYISLIGVQPLKTVRTLDSGLSSFHKNIEPAVQRDSKRWRRRPGPARATTCALPRPRWPWPWPLGQPRPRPPWLVAAAAAGGRLCWNQIIALWWSGACTIKLATYWLLYLMMWT